MFFSLLLQESSFVTVFSDNLGIIMIVTFALYVLSFTFITKAFLFSKPKKTDTLGKQSWKTIDEQKEFEDFRIAKIDMNEKIETAIAALQQEATEEEVKGSGSVMSTFLADMYQLFTRHFLWMKS